MFPTLNGLPAQRKPKKLLDQVRDVMRRAPLQHPTERCYCDWIVRFIRFHGSAHPQRNGGGRGDRFLTHLAREGNVAASTQNQALSALLFDSLAPRLSRPLGLPVCSRLPSPLGSLQGGPQRGDRLARGSRASDQTEASPGGVNPR